MGLPFSPGPLGVYFCAHLLSGGTHEGFQTILRMLYVPVGVGKFGAPMAILNVRIAPFAAWTVRVRLDKSAASRTRPSTLPRARKSVLALVASGSTSPPDVTVTV